MKKQIRITLCALSLIAFSSSIYAQNWATGTNLLFSNPSTSTRVGIGTTLPSQELHILDNGSGYGWLQLTLQNTTSSAGLSLQTAASSWEIQNIGGSGGLLSSLVFYNRTNNLYALTVTPSGNVGIGTGSVPATEKVEITGNIKVNGKIVLKGTNGIECAGMQVNGTNKRKFGIYNDYWNTNSRKLYFMPAKADDSDWEWGTELVLDGDGSMMKSVLTNSVKAFSVYNVGITKDVFRVMGDGKVYATEVNVMLAANFPDYVFASEYNLMSLKDLEQYITANKHLPGVPSAQDVANNGNSINLGEMQTVLLQKVEELTLYTIDQQKQIDAQKELLQKQQELIQQLLLQMKGLQK